MERPEGSEANGRQGESPTEELQRLRSRVAELERRDAEHRELERKLRDSEERFRADDITQQKRAIDAMLESEKMFRAIADYTYSLEAWIGTDGRLIWMNPAIERFTGYTAEECKAMADFPARLLHPEDRSRLLALYAKACAGSSGNDVRYRLLHRDGSILWVSASWQPICGIDGKPLGWRSSHRDVTDRVRVEEALRASESKFRQFFGTLPEYAYIVSPEGTILDLNEAAIRALGYEREEILGRSLSMIYAPQSRARMRELFAQWRQEGHLAREEMEIVCKDGRTRPVLLNAGAVRDGAGRILYSAVIQVDITEQKQAQQQAEQRQAELLHVSRLSTLGEMASGLAHELNQPLTAVMSFAGAALRSIQAGDVDKGRLAGILEQVVSQSTRAGEIIRRVRALAQRRQFRLRPVDVNKIVEDVLGLLATGIRHKEVDVVPELADGLPTVLADSIQLEQVLLNLVGNAIEAMESVEPQQRRLTLRTLAESGGAVKVVVSDTGPEIGPEMRARMFNPFFTTKEDGLGVGLSISRSIIESHHGQLWLDPEPGRGCTFAFTLRAIASK